MSMPGEIRKATVWSACVGAAAFAPGAAFAQAAGAAPGTAEIAQILLGLVVVVAAVVVFARLLARVQGGRFSGNGPLRVVAALSVGQRERVVLMQVGDRQVLIGVTPSQISRLHELDAPVAQADMRSEGADAQTWFDKVISRRS
jgi:flagellar protein FliO/FliZ